jgi:hypothetical protein
LTVEQVARCPVEQEAFELEGGRLVVEETALLA